MILTITGDYASRRRSYELLAKAFGLAASAGAAHDRLADDRQATGAIDDSVSVMVTTAAPRQAAIAAVAARRCAWVRPP